MSQLFKFRLAISLALLLLFSAAKTSYVLTKENGLYRTELSSQAKGDYNLHKEHHAPVAVLFLTITDASNSVWQSNTSGGGASGRFPDARTIRFQDKGDVEFNFIRWHVLHHLIQQSELRGRYPQHGFW